MFQNLVSELPTPAAVTVVSATTVTAQVVRSSRELLAGVRMQGNEEGAHKCRPLTAGAYRDPLNSWRYLFQTCSPTW